MARRWQIGAFIMLVFWMALSASFEAPSVAAPRMQIVQPGDVATPTATYTIILVPTPTATPAPEPSMDSSLLAPVGYHGVESSSIYKVRAGDTLLTVALEVGVDVTDLPCAVAPTFSIDQPLVIGDSLEIPASSWNCHLVGRDESLTRIATQYGVDPTEVIGVAWNQLDASALGEKALPEGRYLRIPPAMELSEGGGGFLNFMLDQPLSMSPVTAYSVGGTKARTTTMIGPIPKDWPYGSGHFMWPVFGYMTQGYRADHRAIDIAANTGTFVTASDRGVVIRSGWNDQGYGMFVVIDHNIDYITLYAHMSDIYVDEGDVVAQGQIIGTIGSTGNSTGPHLHFEIRDFGRRANPLELLMR
jgi:murein DD-endopeptidase MepM/ murein hydrolase activator NlpD